MVGVGQRRVAVVTVCSLLLSPPIGIPAAALAAAAPAAAATVPDNDGGWPRSYPTPSGAAFVIYQPQVASWADQTTHRRCTPPLRTRPKAQRSRRSARVKLEADTAVALPERLVNFIRLQAHRLELSDARTRADPHGGRRDRRGRSRRRIGSSRSTACWRASTRARSFPKNVDGVKADPPVIFYSTSPAVLVNLDGDPIWSPIKDNDLKFAVNTNWDLFEHAPSKTLLPALQRRAG